MLDLNGVYTNLLPYQEAHHIFSVYIPEAGEIRIILDKCSTIKPFFHFREKSSNKLLQIKMEESHYQGYEFLKVDATGEQATVDDA